MQTFLVTRYLTIARMLQSRSLSSCHKPKSLTKICHPFCTNDDQNSNFCLNSIFHFGLPGYLTSKAETAPCLKILGIGVLRAPGRVGSRWPRCIEEQGQENVGAPESRETPPQPKWDQRPRSLVTQMFMIHSWSAQLMKSDQPADLAVNMIRRFQTHSRLNSLD